MGHGEKSGERRAKSRGHAFQPAISVEYRSFLCPPKWNEGGSEGWGHGGSAVRSER